MTESEAIKELHKIRPRGGIIPQKRAEALDVAIQALEKQIPTKVLHSYDDIIDEMWCYCPTCYAGLGWGNVDTHKYCMNCGQKLDWGDEE